MKISLENNLRNSFYGWYKKESVQRDGALTSLGQYKMPDYISSSALTGELFDVLIVGGAITVQRSFKELFLFQLPSPGLLL